jgi:signal transduction histidine kinase
MILHLRKYLLLNRELRNEYKRIFLTMQVTIIAIIACISFTFLDLLDKFYTSILLDISTIVALSFSFFLISKGHFNYSKFLVILFSCFSLLINGCIEGRQAGNEFLWFPTLGAIFLFFSPKEKWFITLSCLFALISIVFLETTGYANSPNANRLSSFVLVNYLICFSISIFMICVFIYYLIKANTDSEKKLERLNQTLLKRNENLKKTNHELDSFVYKASHDLRAPLTSLLGLIEISKRETDPDTLKKFLTLQEKSIQKLDRYIVDILNISRNARMELQYEPVHFLEMLEQIFNQLQYIENCPRVKKTITVNENSLFVSDILRLNVVLSNLISNSIRYADLSKPESCIFITINITAEQAELTIWDNGIGIGEEHLRKVFNMFYRGTEINSGSGLGLYIVKETLQKIKGTITIRSEDRKYTEVKVLLPNYRNEQSAKDQ